MSSIQVYTLLLLIAGSSAQITALNATCNDDNTMTVVFPFNRTALVLEMSYGTCTHESVNGVKGLDQNGDFSWEITLNLTECEMDNQVRAIEYIQKANFRVGRLSPGIGGTSDLELTLATFDIDSYCSFTDTYEVTFDYGNITAAQSTFTDPAGNVTLAFAIRAYDETYAFENHTHSVVAGNHIYLGLIVHPTSVFDYEERTFAPESCRVTDTSNGFLYTLFDTTFTNGCTNTDVELAVSYDHATFTWRFSHVLFLLGDFDESTFQLTCTVKVCDLDSAADCDNVSTVCGTVLASSL